MLKGILDELRKEERLTDFGYLSDKILMPAIAYVKERKLITAMKASVLLISAKSGVAKAAGLAAAMPAPGAPYTS